MPRARTMAVLVALAAVPVLGQPPAAPAPNPPAGVRPAPATRGPDAPGRGGPTRFLARFPAGPLKLDRHGDPLPAGAVARFGSIRLRHGSGLTTLGFTQDGKHLVSTSATEDGFRVWESATGKEVARLSTPVAAAAVAPDRSILYVVEGRARVWEPFGEGRIRELPPDTLPAVGVSAVAVHPNGKLFAASVPPGIALIDLATGERKAELRVPADQVPQRIAFSPDGKWVAAAGQRTGVWLWDTATLRRVRTYPNQGDHLDFAFSPDGRRLAVAGGPLAVYHTDSEEPVDGFGPPADPVHAARFSADGKSVYAVGVDGSVVRLDAATGDAKDTWPAAEGVDAQPPLALAADAAWVAAMDDTGGIRVWNPRDGTGPAVERLSVLSDPGFSADGKGATALGETGKVVSFDPTTGAPGKVAETSLLGDGGIFWDARSGLAAGIGRTGDDAVLHVVDVARQKVIARIPLPTGDAPWAAFSPTDPARVVVFTPGTVGVYDARTGDAVRTFSVGPTEGAPQGVLSPDGRLVALATNPVTVWEVATGRKRFELAGTADAVALTFSPDGRRLAAADPTTAVVYDLRTGGVARRLRPAGDGPYFTVLAFSPDGAKLATGGEDGVVLLWDVGSGEPVVAFDRHEGPVTGLAFSGDGRRLLSTSVDGTALVWDATARPAESAIGGADEALAHLASPDPAVAHRGMAYLFRSPDAAVTLLGDRVPVPAAVPTARIDRLVVDLGSPEFPVREAAVRELAAIGSEAGPTLRRAAAAPPNPEARRLAGDLLNRLAAAPSRPDDLRALRTVEILEAIGTPAARDVLARWAAGPAHHRQTTEAAAALRRLGPRP